MTSLDEMLAQLQTQYQEKQQSKITANSSSKVNTSTSLDSVTMNQSSSEFSSIDHFLDEIQSQGKGAKEINYPENKDNKAKSSDLTALSEIEQQFQVGRNKSEKGQSADLLALKELEQKFQHKSPPLTSIDDLAAELVKSKPSTTANSSNVDQLLTNFEQQRQQQLSSSQAQSARHRLDDTELEKLQQQYQQKQQTTAKNQQELLEEIKAKELAEQRHKKALENKAQQWLKNLDPHSDEGFWFEQFAANYESKLQAAMDYLEALN